MIDPATLISAATTILIVAVLAIFSVSSIVYSWENEKKETIRSLEIIRESIDEEIQKLKN